MLTKEGFLSMRRDNMATCLHCCRIIPDDPDHIRGHEDTCEQDPYHQRKKFKCDADNCIGKFHTEEDKQWHMNRGVHKWDYVADTHLLIITPSPRQHRIYNEIFYGIPRDGSVHSYSEGQDQSQQQLQHDLDLLRNMRACAHIDFQCNVLGESSESPDPLESRPSPIAPHAQLPQDSQHSPPCQGSSRQSDSAPQRHSSEASATQHQNPTRHSPQSTANPRGWDQLNNPSLPSDKPYAPQFNSLRKNVLHRIF